MSSTLVDNTNLLVLSTYRIMGHVMPLQDIAHLDGPREQTVAEHALGVLGYGLRSLAAARLDHLKDLYTWTALLHDIGKYRKEFQSYIRGKSPSTPLTQHAIFGAVAAHQHGLPLPVMFAIAGHHAGLYDYQTLCDRIKNNQYAVGLGLPKIITPLWQRLFSEVPKPITPLWQRLFSEVPKPNQLKPDQTVCPYDQEFGTRLLFSALVDADWLDTEEFMKLECRYTQKLEPEKLIGILDAYVAQIPTQANPSLREIRDSIYSACSIAGSRPRGFYSLTTPTGGGKTLSGMAFALQHAKAHGHRRIIVVLPYLSIIEQNAAQYRDVFGEGVVLEHHSGVLKDQELEFSLPSDSATENWDAPIIVTTAVQFLESLFARRTGQCRKLHNIANSVVILDEAQTLPHTLLEPILSAMRSLHRLSGTTFVFCTATQPGFQKCVELPSGFSHGELSELAPDPHGTFGSLSRVDYFVPAVWSPWTMRRLADEIESDDSHQVLVVLNLRRHAAELFKELKSRGVGGLFHLSSAMCGAHRTARLGKRRNPEPGTIYHALENNQPCVVISTQVIEAGVDIDFPVVYRALGPLDSIIQAAGRCNREWELQSGRVVVFDLEDYMRYPGDYYAEAASITLEHLGALDGDYSALSCDPEFYARYHAAMLRLRPDVGKNIQDERLIPNFAKVASEFRVIEDCGTAVVAPFKGSMAILNEIKDKPKLGKEDLRRLQPYMVSLRDKVLEQVRTKPICGSSILVLLSPYDRDLGVCPESSTEAEFSLPSSGCYHNGSPATTV